MVVAMYVGVVVLTGLLQTQGCSADTSPTFPNLHGCDYYLLLVRKRGFGWRRVVQMTPQQLSEASAAAEQETKVTVFEKGQVPWRPVIPSAT
jgi:hypothetical protein